MHIMTTEDEGDFFETSKEVMERVVALVKNANFASELKAEHDIPYAEQAIEYSLDAVNDILFKKNIHLDN